MNNQSRVLLVLLLAVALLLATFHSPATERLQAQEPGAFEPVRVAVDATVIWNNTGLVLNIGQAYEIEVTGIAGTQCTADNCPDESFSGPAGQETLCTTQLDSRCLADEAPYGSLVGRVGAGIPFLVGEGGLFTAETTGVLLLAVNDNRAFYDDNVDGFEAFITPASAAEQPERVVIPGTFQSELGCDNDWDPACDLSALTFDESLGRWAGQFDLPADLTEFKVALNGTWDENYGGVADRDGPNVELTLPEALPVLFTYNHLTNQLSWAATRDMVNLPGSFQTALGCSMDWAPHCAASQMADDDADAIYEWTTTDIPAGEHEVKVAVNGLWDINYGAGGVFDGENIPFTVPVDGAEVTFSFSLYDDVLTIRVAE